MEGVKEAVQTALGVTVAHMSPINGGDINDAYGVTTTDGRRFFVKTRTDAPRGMFEAEAQGLRWMGQAGTLRVPEVLGVGDGDTDVRFLLLEMIERGPPGKNFDETLGRGLALMHKAGAPCFGHVDDNFIGNLPQSNRNRDAWHVFLREERLQPQLKRAIDGGRASHAMKSGFESLFHRLPEALGPPEPPSRLHGDLWAGNHLVADDGAPVLIDPAVYGGHREMDLGLMHLFGGFSSRVFDAYNEAFPLHSDWRQRIALCQLYPLMVHVNLFGGAYVEQVERIVSRF